MKIVCLVLALFAAAVSSQPIGPGASEPKPSPGVTLYQPQPQPQPQTQPQARPQAQPHPQVSGVPARMSRGPQGCSPGCNSEEICAELGNSYCRTGANCNVCIKLNSIRLPASPLSGMFQASVPQPAAAPAATRVRTPIGQ